jgi:hypothetical protein
VVKRTSSVEYRLYALRLFFADAGTFNTVSTSATPDWHREKQMLKTEREPTESIACSRSAFAVILAALVICLGAQSSGL